jgi:spore coat protein U-like protein
MQEKSMLKSSLGLSLLLVLLSLFFFMGEGQAATCNFTSAGNVAFGSYNPLSANPPLDSTGSFSIQCNYNPSRNVTISIGTSLYSGGFNPRKMKNSGSADLLNYNLYTTSARTVIWGDGTQGTSTVSQVCLRNVVYPFTIYGRVPASQDVGVGTYSDQVVITITF